jgi:[acyl-carrier-protein] S-malonyltransferase
MAHAFVFPGQGSQRVGMGKALADAYGESRAVFEEADEVLGFRLSKLCFEGPEAELQLTANTQPAILATSIAVLRRLETLGVQAQAVAGHSLGEYSALVAAGSLSLADALRLVRRRGELMQEAVPVGVGAMAAVLGLEAAQVEAVAARAATETAGVCAVANHNAPGQIVIAGHRVAVERAVEIAKEAGARRSLLLPVSAPFHCALMAPARAGMEPLLRATELLDPRVPVVTNVDAAEIHSGTAARDALIRQIDSPVRWIESIERMRALGCGDFVEVGPGGVLTGLLKRIDRAANGVAIGEPEDFAKLNTACGVRS